MTPEEQVKALPITRGREHAMPRYLEICAKVIEAGEQLYVTYKSGSPTVTGGRLVTLAKVQGSPHWEFASEVVSYVRKPFVDAS